MTKELRSGQFKNAPLIYTLAQVVISPVLKMEEKIPEIQEMFRNKNFPKFKESMIQEVVFDPMKGGFPNVSNKKRWEFFNKDNTKGISITQNFIVFHTTDYTNFEDFSKTLEEILNTVKKASSPNLVERIGLRYVDLIRAAPDKGLEFYLQKGLLGFHIKSQATGKGKNTLSRCESLVNTEYGALVAKCTQYDDGTYLPPDLGAEGLLFDQNKVPVKGEKVCILDFDHFVIETKDFVVKEIIELFSKLHDVSGDAFRSSTTPEAMKVWNPTGNQKKKI